MRRAARAHAHRAVHVSQVTTTRKIFTTVYSVFRNPDNSLLMAQWGGCGLVFVGLLLEIVEAAVCPKKKKPAAPPAAEQQSIEEGTPLRSAAEEDDNLEELERQNRPLLR